MNNLIKLLVDTGRLRINKFISIEDNLELNELELKLRKELAYIHAMDLRCGNIYLHKSQFEPRISDRFANKVIFKAFPIIGKNSDLNGLPFKWKSTRDYDPYFFKYKNPIDRSPIDKIFVRPFASEYRIGTFGMKIAKDPDDIDNLYIGED